VVIDKTPPPPPSETFEAQLLLLLAKQARRVPLPVFVCTCMIAGMAASSIALPWLAGWLALVVGVLAVRWRVIGTLDQRTSIPLRTRLRIAILLSALNGTLHGASLFFFPALPLFERAVQSMILIGMSAGAVATTGGHAWVFRAYAAPTLVPLALLWGFDSQFDAAGWVHWVMAIMIFVFALLLDAVARDMFRLLRESFDIRLERAALNRELQQALERAESASRAKTRFLASASHDLRQPMQTLALFAAALALRPLDERSRTIAQHMNEALHDLTAELDALLDVSKLDAGVIQAQPDAVKLAPLLRRIADLFQPAAEEKSLLLTVSCPDHACIRTDRKLFERVIRNLVENAVKYTDAGRVEMSVSGESGCWRLQIRDTGCGIPESEQSKVFEEFYQLDNPERDRRRGLGLGLAIVRRLVDLLDVELELRSVPGEGTCFTLVADGISPVGTSAVLRGDEPAGGLAKLKIMVVDDEEGVRLGMKALLEELGCSVMLASETDEARTLATRAAPDLLIADFRLRGTDNGIQTIKALRELSPEMPALLMTGETAPDRLREARDAGAHVIHKPVVADALKQELARLVCPEQEGGSHEFIRGELRS
jgi:signal transduction histidine kinase/ActR/RegA family two-component response regulator